MKAPSKTRRDAAMCATPNQRTHAATLAEPRTHCTRDGARLAIVDGKGLARATPAQQVSASPSLHEPIPEILKMNHCSGLKSLIFACSIVLAILAPIADAADKPLRVSNNGRFLQTTNGEPFFWNGDTNWRLYKLNPTQVVQYLNNRKARGFNIIQGPVLTHFSSYSETTTYNGQGNTNPNSPNLNYFDHIDFIIDAAAERGMYIAPVVAWGTFHKDFPGSTVAARAASARAYGEWLGARYRNKTNLVWIVAAEFNIDGTGNDIKTVWNALGEGLKTGNQGKQLITIHPSYQEGRQSSADMFHDAPWLSFNMLQSSHSGDTGPGSANFLLVKAAYNKTPAKPVLDAEPHYEGIAAWSDAGVRRRAYWNVFAGGFGHTYGANGVWNSYRGGYDTIEFGATTVWSEAITWTGSKHMKHMRALMESRPALQRVPAPNLLLTPSGTGPEHLIGTRHKKGHYAMVYVPKKNKTFTVNTSLLSGQKIRAWWFNCRNGKARNAGTFTRGPFRIFTSPDAGLDWVLVLDDRSRGYAKPGAGNVTH